MHACCNVTLKIEVPFPLFDLFDSLAYFTRYFFVQLMDVLFNHLPSLPCRFFRGIIHQVLCQCEHRVGGTEPFDEARNREFHEVFAGAPQPVTGGAERGQHILRQQFLDDFVQGAVVVNQELPLVEVVRLLLLGVAPQLDAGATVYLRHAELGVRRAVPPVHVR